MRALLITQVFPPRKGGSGRWLFELYRRLPWGSAHVVAADEPGAEAFDRTHDLPTRRLALPTSSWGLLNRRGLIEHTRALWRLSGEVKRVCPDVIHCGKALPEGLLAWGLKAWHGLPYLCYVHGEELLLARTSKELRWLTRRALLGAEAVIANSRHTRDLLVRDWDLSPERIHVMHPGVDTTKFVPAPHSEEARALLGWRGRTVVLTVGALQKRKGQDMMLRALPVIRKQVPNVLYAIAGEGWERGYLEGLVQELGLEDCVQMRGIPDDAELIHCYQQCDLFALPNRQVGWDFEGFGIVLLEAQACGKPVLAGASGGTAETMDPPHTGWVVPCDRPEPLAEEVVRLLRDGELRERMGALGREWVVSRLDWAPLTRQAERLFGMATVQGSAVASPATENVPAGVP
jgi:phosphatidylinositol alpha-1,6-mannosyltransferase